MKRNLWMNGKKLNANGTCLEGLFFLVASTALFVYSLYFHADSGSQWKQSPYLFPLVIAVFLFLLSLSLLREGRQEGSANRADGEVAQGPVADISWKKTAVVTLLVFAYMQGIGLVGFILATFLFLVATFLYLKERRLWLIASLSIAFPLVVYVLFGMLLHVMLP